MNTIPDEYYDYETYNLLYTRLTDNEKENLDTNNPINDFIFKRWRTILNSLPTNYYQQYCSKTSQQDRNEWFKKYLDYPPRIFH
jgi:hypothetical protein